jgi:hypothetical protein
MTLCGISVRLSQLQFTQGSTTQMDPSSGPHTTSSTITYPPRAYTVGREIVSSQPSPLSMSLSPSPQNTRPPQRGEQTQSPMRLRGGCVPCPVSSRVQCNNIQTKAWGLGGRNVFHHSLSVLLNMDFHRTFGTRTISVHTI